MSISRQERRILKRSKVIGVGLLLGFCILLMGQTAFGQEFPATKKSLMLFPLAVPAMQPGPQADAVAQFSRDLFSLVAEGVAANRAYSAIKFQPRIASIQRAVREQKCDEKEIVSAIDTDPAGAARALKLARFTGSQLAILGSIDKYVYEAGKSGPGQPAAPGKVDMSATLLLIDVNSGKELYRFVSNGQASMDDSNEMTIGTAATYDLAQKLLTDINKATLEVVVADSAEEDIAAHPVVFVTETRKSGKGLLPAMIAAALLGLLIGGK